MGWQLLNQNETSKPASEEGLDNPGFAIDEKAFYPFTFPLTVGPGGMAVVLTFSAHLNRESRLLVTLEQGAAVIGIFLMCVVVSLCYRNLNFMTKRFQPPALWQYRKLSLSLYFALVLRLPGQVLRRLVISHVGYAQRTLPIFFIFFFYAGIKPCLIKLE
jgi:hypothetical protein